MSIKVQLAELCANRKLPMDAFKKLSAFLLLEKEADIIERIEGFRLPEITKLICGSDALGDAPWADKYAKIKPLYFSTNEIDAQKIISGYKSVAAFEKEILCFADEVIIRKFSDYYHELQELQSTKRKERTKLQKSINATKKNDDEATKEPGENIPDPSKSAVHDGVQPVDGEPVQTMELSADEKKLQEIKAGLAVLDKYLKQHKGFIEAIQLYEVKVKDYDSDENREKAYLSLNDMKMPQEEAFLKDFISSGTVSEEFHSLFRDPGFVNRILQCLDKGSFKDYSLPILLRLYDEGAVDLIEGPASDFIDAHPERLCDYLVENLPESVADFDDSELGLLVEKAIQKELSSPAIPFFPAFWNSITDDAIWRWIVIKVSEIANDACLSTAITALMPKLEGKAAKVLVEVLFDDPGTEVKMTTSEVISALLKNSGSSDRDIVLEIIRLIEQNNRKIQRKLNTAERKLRSQGQELFSSVYLPMEQLEELAINLKLTNGDIKASLVAAHMIDIIISLREGFESLDLHPTVEMDDWKYQNKLAFDPNAHRVTADCDVASADIRLRSMGFRYQDDDGEWQQYNAQASMEFDSPKKEEVKPRKGYPKYEQPGKKKNGTPSRYTVSKKAKHGGKIQKNHHSDNRKKK